MAFTPQGFMPDPEHVEAATITPNNPRVSAAALAEADKYAKPHTVSDTAPAVEPGTPLTPSAVTVPSKAAFRPAGFKPDPPKPITAEPLTNEAGISGAEKSPELQQEEQSLVGPNRRLAEGMGLAVGGEMLGGGLAAAASAFRAARAVQAAAKMPYGVEGATGGRFSMQRLSDILAEDADNVMKATQNGTKIPPFQEWGRVAETLTENSKTASALKTLWSDPKYKIVRWATLAALTGGTGGAGMARYMAHRAMYDAVVP